MASWKLPFMQIEQCMQCMIEPTRLLYSTDAFIKESRNYAK